MSQQMELEAGAEAKATDDRGLVPGPEPAQAPAEYKDTAAKKRKPRMSKAAVLASNDMPHQRWGGCIYLYKVNYRVDSFQARAALTNRNSRISNN